MLQYRNMLATGAIAATLLVTGTPAAAAAAPAQPGGRILLLDSERSDRAGTLTSVRPDGTGVFDYGQELPAYASPDYSPDGGEIAYTQGFDIRAMSAVDGSGDRWLIGAPCGPAYPRWSPDGQWVAFESCGDIRTVHKDNADTGHRLVTPADGGNLQPAWSPTGARIATAAVTSVNIYRSAEGTTTRTLSDLPATQLDWSPNGRTIAVQARGDLWLVDAVTGRERQVTNTPDVYESSPVWSPDGRWLAYASGAAAPPTPPFPDDPAPPPAVSTASLNPQIWLMTATGADQHSTGVAGVPTSWRTGK
ncbi:hypothetical protein [Actinoplanes sp. DH11]|uniref:TolB family protein n=1 Tax=Actinoplanes sp. DH11 TaxID=2857011 RepID=UPI001E49EEE5|nr:hypothetical protein [Actinoplanes sp. DH11]